MNRLPQPERIFVYGKPVDMRKSFDGLYELVGRCLLEQPTSGDPEGTRPRSRDLSKDVVDALARAKEMGVDEVAAFIVRTSEKKKKLKNRATLLQVRYLFNCRFGASSEKRTLINTENADQILLDVPDIHRVIEVLELVWSAQNSSILQSEVLSADETPTPAGRRNGKMKKGYYWAFHGDRNEVSFLYSRTRSWSFLEDFTENLEGTLLSDGYATYEKFAEQTGGVLWAGCWAHVRRKFVEAETLRNRRASPR